MSISFKEYTKSLIKIKNFYKKAIGIHFCNIFLLLTIAPFLYPLETSENLTVFWCFQGVEKRWIRNKWVKEPLQISNNRFFNIQVHLNLKIWSTWAILILDFSDISLYYLKVIIVFSVDLSWYKKLCASFHFNKEE